MAFLGINLEVEALMSSKISWEMPRSSLIFSCEGGFDLVSVVKEGEEDVFVYGEGAPEGGGHKWLKTNVKKTRPVKPVTNPVHAASRKKRPMLRRD
jgi:hypothetical protein